MLRVAIVASEASPYVKTGGLGDVVGALPKALSRLGCEVKVFVPKYSLIDESKYELHYESTIGEMGIRVGRHVRSVHVLRSRMVNADVDIYFVDCPHYFNRRSIYTNDPDEDERFVLFSKGVIETMQRLKWAPDIVHCNDWQTGLVPVYLKDNYGWDRLFGKTACLMSIHNIAYQGRFSPSILLSAELRGELFAPGKAFEFHGSVSLLKAGVEFSEIITTVSETYSREILSPQYGAGMEEVLRPRRDDLFGVLNGIDEEVWNPEHDHLIPTRYSIMNPELKEENKKYLLGQTSIKYVEGVPLIGLVSRLVPQKGFDLIAEAINELMGLEAQWVILGSGEDYYENLFRAMGNALPQRVWSYIGFSNELAHLVEAGADMFLMPSRYEPCGLNQMYSLKYGTVPIVRKTGGLADTVQDWHEVLAMGKTDGDGFSFNDTTGYALYSTVRRAIETYHDKITWRRIQLNGMNRDYSWAASAAKYVELYGKAISKRRG